MGSLEESQKYEIAQRFKFIFNGGQKFQSWGFQEWEGHARLGASCETMYLYCDWQFT